MKMSHLTPSIVIILVFPFKQTYNCPTDSIVMFIVMFIVMTCSVAVVSSVCINVTQSDLLYRLRVMTSSAVSPSPNHHRAFVLLLFLYLSLLSLLK